MKTRIEFYVNHELFDVRDWSLTPAAGMLVTLINSADDSMTTLVIDRVIAVGDEDAFKFIVVCVTEDEHVRRLTAGSRRTP